MTSTVGWIYFLNYRGVNKTPRNGNFHGVPHRYHVQYLPFFWLAFLLKNQWTFIKTGAEIRQYFVLMYVAHPRIYM
jgi:hypothetical protein